MKNSLLKSIRFNMDDAADRELYEFLSRLPRGEFSSSTKEYWIEEMEHEKVKQERLRKIERENEGK
jgi:hypothetical protein